MSKIPEDFKMELFGVDIDLRTILGDVNCDVRACDVPLTQEEHKEFVRHIQASCQIAVNGLHRKMAEQRSDDIGNS